jgi:linoleoyl-CoA desaturase
MMPDEWTVHEMMTTSNFARKSALLTWYVGGLNYQVEHHLFPKVCSIHYPDIAPIVERVAERHNVPYNAHSTLWIAIKSHYVTLRQLGQDAWAHRNETPVLAKAA